MDTQSVGFLLVGVLVSSTIIVLFIYLGSGILNFLKIPDPPRASKNRRNPEAEILKPGSLRRKIESKPNIVCSLPIHQEKRQEAPLS